MKSTALTAEAYRWPQQTPIRDGCISPPDRPGLSMEIGEAAARQFRAA
jgi:hypothetical protein